MPPISESHAPQPQKAVVTFLAEPATHGGAPVKRIDTHAASVFLAGGRALKIKRAVRFPFLDYSTLAKRKAACEAELEVNRPFAPQLYRRVLAITREADGTLALAGDGTPIEWAVEMQRFDENATLDRLADAGKLDASLADALGRAIAAAHARAPSAPAAPWIAALATYTEQNDAAFRAMPDLFEPHAVEALTEQSRAAHARLFPLLAERGRLGLVRRGHGDLHLGNIVLIDDKPVLFDAIEFDPLIASGDVLYDLAFLLMDLCERNLSALAHRVLNRYLLETRRVEDLDALAALPLFISLRAAIRAKVTAARFKDAPQDPSIRQNAQRYFTFANNALAPHPPVLIAIGGLSGTGKSLLAHRLALDFLPSPSALVLRSDVERKALFGKAESEPLPAEAYTPAVTRRVYATIVDKARRALAAGYSAIVDAVFASPGERTAVELSAKALGVPLYRFFLTADLATRLARVGARRGDASDADAKVVAEQERYALGALDWAQIDASGTPDDTLARTRLALRAQGS